MFNVMGRLAVAALLAVPLSQSVRADTLMPDLKAPGATEWKGESQLCSEPLGCASVGGDSIFVDWVVQYDSTNNWYNYYYQLENTSSPTNGTVIDTFVMNFDAADPFFYLGWVGGNSPVIKDPRGNVPVDPSIPADLDQIHNLAGEAAEPTGGVVAPTAARISMAGLTASWFFDDPILQGSESVTLVARAWGAPGYGDALAHDHVTPSPWSTMAGDAIPIPGPEPAGLILMGSAMLAATTLLRRSRKKNV